MSFATLIPAATAARLERLCRLAALICVASLAPMVLAVDARTLPKGRSRFSVTAGFSTDIRDVFKDDGRRESAVADYNLELSAENFKAADPRIQQLITWLNGTGLHYDSSLRSTTSYGIVSDPSKPMLGDALERGFLDVNAQGSRSQYNLMYQYGLTDQLSIGFAVPIIKQGVNLNTAITGSNTAEDIMHGFPQMDPQKLQDLVDNLVKIKNLSTEDLQSLIQSYGYNRVESEARSGIGDVVLGGRFKYVDASFRSGQWTNSAQLGMTVPIGQTFGPADVLAIDFGQGAWDVAPSHIINFKPTLLPWLTLSNSVNFTHRFASSSVKRVKKDPSDFLPDASSEEVLAKQLGDKFWFSFGGNAAISSFLNLDLSYEWYWKSQDVYQGHRTDRDYTYLSNATALYLETLSVGLTFSSIKAFLDYKFPLPGDFSFTYYQPIRGRNSVIAPFAAMELALYF